MEYIIYIFAAAGVHNLWLYQDIFSKPRMFLDKLRPWTKAVLCPPCFALWALLGMMFVGPYLHTAVLYTLAAYTPFLMYLSFRTAFVSLTKKLDLFLDNKAHNERQIRFGQQMAPTAEPNEDGTTYVTGPGSKIIKGPPRTPAGNRVETDECTDCNKEAKADIEKK